MKIIKYCVALTSTNTAQGHQALDDYTAVQLYTPGYTCTFNKLASYLAESPGAVKHFYSL